MRLRAASIVKRWSIIWTLQPDNIAEHSFFVALYSRQIAKLIGWEGDYSLLYEWALIHDLDELVTGDIVGTVKHNIIDPKKNSDFISIKMNEQLSEIHNMRIGLQDHPDFRDVAKIVKAADRLDATLFVIKEMALGNQIIGSRVYTSKDRLRDVWFKLPHTPSLVGVLYDTWNIVDNAITQHMESINYDIALAPKA